MIELGPATEDQMILAFLQGEVDSSRFSPRVNQILDALGRDRTLIDSPDLRDASENNARRCILLNGRGYPNAYLFHGWPHDAVWRHVRLEPGDFATMKYASKVESLHNLSGGTRLACHGAANYSRGVADPNAWSHLDAILARLRGGERFAPLIAAQSIDDSSLVLIEGHSRATAYLIEAKNADVEAFIATSPSMAAWYYY